MKQYISTIIYICIFSIILELILPNTKLKKYISTLVGLIVVIVIMSPIVGFLKYGNVKETISTVINDVTDGTKNKSNSYGFKEYQDKAIKGNVKSNLEKDILDNCKKRFGGIIHISKVNLELDDSYIIQCITIYTEKINDVSQASDIISYVTETYEVQEKLIKVMEENR